MDSLVRPVCIIKKTSKNQCELGVENRIEKQIKLQIELNWGKNH